VDFKPAQAHGIPLLENLLSGSHQKYISTPSADGIGNSRKKGVLDFVRFSLAERFDDARLSVYNKVV
jgi:hypothetical protein